MDDRNKDQEHLKLLSIFHYVLGGVLALFSCFPIIHLVVGLTMLSGGFEDSSQKGPPKEIGYIFVGFALAFILGGWLLATCIIIAGKCLAKRTHYMYCMVIAGISCLYMPIGTILGVFTIIVLSRLEVKELFLTERINHRT